jgi:acetyl coenzyme A synthetase (ADP forming)-like protein
MLSSLNTMFAPRSVAIIGASRREGTLGRMFLDAVRQMRYRGKIYPVNPKSEEIDGIRCYQDIKNLPETPDLAVILIARDFVLEAIDQLAEKNVKNIIVVSAGFKETGDVGAQLEEKLKASVRKYKMRMIGPNSMGLFNTDPSVSLNATFSPTAPSPGHVAFISQSGALGVAVLELSNQLNLGFSIFVSTGNKADVGDVDILKFAAEDPNTKVITLYQESADHPLEFRKICIRTVPNKPVLVLKGGRTVSGVRAASSHTGALSSDERIGNAFLKQSGVIRCMTLKELLQTALALEKQPLPPGNRIAVVTNAGGPGILASDAIEDAGLSLPELSHKTISALKKILPAEAGVRNPVDMIASATHETYRLVCEILLSDPLIDTIFLIIVKPPVATTPRLIMENLSSLVQNSQKAFFVTLMTKTDKNAGIDLFHKSNIPVFHYPEEAALVLGNMNRYRIIRNNIKDIPQPETEEDRTSGKKIQASFEEIMNRLLRYDIGFSPYIVTSDIHEALSFQKRTGSVALKVANEQILHKSDQGLVRLNLQNQESVRKSFTELFERAKPLLKSESQIKILVQKMIDPGIELVLGSTYDPTFGPVIMFGIGGIFVELYKDVAFRVLPVDKTDIIDMIFEIKASKLFRGFRNQPAIDFEILSGTILNFAQLIQTHKDIVEMDLNPVIIPFNSKKPVVADARMTVVVNKTHEKFINNV